jgi:hypothetical protein
MKENPAAVRLSPLMGMERTFFEDRNFGIFQLVQRVCHANAHGMFRLTLPRGRRWAGGERRRRRCGDDSLCWTPRRDDLRHPGGDPRPVNGRLIVAQYSRPGFRPRSRGIRRP